MTGELVQNAHKWLKACCHGICCHTTPSKNVCHEQHCASMKELMLHILTSPRTSCEQPSHASSTCRPVRQLIAHWVLCQEPSCSLCSDLWAALSSGTAAANGHLEDTSSGCSDDSSWSDDDEEECSEAEQYMAQEGQETLPSQQQCDSGQHTGTHSVAQHHPCSKLSTLNVTTNEKCSHVIAFTRFLLHSFLHWGGAAQQGNDDMMLSSSNGGQADTAKCLAVGKSLWNHMLRECTATRPKECMHPGCSNAKLVLTHLLTCQDASCPVCIPVVSMFAGPAPARAAQQLEHTDMDNWLNEIDKAVSNLRL